MSNNRTLLIIVGLLAVVALALCGFLGFVFFLQPAPSEPTPTAPVVQADDSWEKIRAAVKIVVTARLMVTAAESQDGGAEANKDIEEKKDA